MEAIIQIFHNYELFWRLIFSVVLGGLIGLERQLARKTAGIRTFSLISLSACLLAIISILLNEKNFPNFSIVTLPSQVITGIGFIGAGLIIFRGSHPAGITTAAGLLASATTGLTIGFGFYTLSFFTTILILVIFIAFWFLEEKIFPGNSNNSTPEND